MPTLVPFALFLMTGIAAVVLVRRVWFNERVAWERRMRVLNRQVAGFQSDTDAASQEVESRARPLPMIERSLGRSPLFRFLEMRLTAAGLNVTPQEFFAMSLVTIVFLFAVGALVTRNPFLSLLSAIVGGALPFLILNVLRNRRKTLLERQLADALVLISSSMQAGYGFLQGIRVASEQLPTPIADEFERVAFNVGLGMSLQNALTGLGERVQSYEYDLMISAVTTQMESGGSITGLLENIAETIRSRNALRDEIRATTAQGKLSGIVLTMLPIALVVGLTFINRKYADLLLETPIGHKILTGAGALLIFGWLMVRKILNVKL